MMWCFWSACRRSRRRDKETAVNNFFDGDPRTCWEVTEEERQERWMIQAGPLRGLDPNPAQMAAICPERGPQENPSEVLTCQLLSATGCRLLRRDIPSPAPLSGPARGTIGWDPLRRPVDPAGRSELLRTALIRPEGVCIGGSESSKGGMARPPWNALCPLIQLTQVYHLFASNHFLWVQGVSLNKTSSAAGSRCAYRKGTFGSGCDSQLRSLTGTVTLQHYLNEKNSLRGQESPFLSRRVKLLLKMHVRD